MAIGMPEERSHPPRVAMLGPSMKSRGGVSTMAHELVGAGLGDVCNLEYIETVCDGNKIRKARCAFAAYTRFRTNIDNYDIVHIHMALRASFTRKRLFFQVARASGKAVVVHMHEGEFEDIYNHASEKHRTRIREVLIGADTLIVLSEEWDSYFSDLTNNRARTLVMYNGISLPAQTKSSCSHPTVLFMGRLDENKSPDVLLRASVALIRLHPETRLLFAGDGELDKYRRLASNLGISENCEFLGWVSGKEKERLFEQSTMFCLPSKNEGMPMSLLEAMGRGLAVVATPVGGIPQVVENQVNGLLVGVDDIQGMSKALCVLADSTYMRERLGAEARNTIEERFNVSNNVKALGALYQSLVRAGGGTQ